MCIRDSYQLACKVIHLKQDNCLYGICLCPPRAAILQRALLFKMNNIYLKYWDCTIPNVAPITTRGTGTEASQYLIRSGPPK